MARKREVLTEEFRLLREVEWQRLYLGRSYFSLFAYCSSCLGYSEPETMLRIQNMGLVRVVPEAGVAFPRVAEAGAGEVEELRNRNSRGSLKEARMRPKISGFSVGRTIALETKTFACA